MSVQKMAPFDRHPAAPQEIPPADLAVEVTTEGYFAPDVPDYARRKVRAAVRHCPFPILRASVRLVRFADPALPRPVVSTALVNVNGRLVRVQTTAESARVGLDALQHSLRTAIERLDRHHTRHGHGRRPAFLGEADDEREIHPHGTYAPTACTVDEAIADLEALDREFHLFHDVEAAEDSVVFRGGPSGYRLARVRHRPLVTPPATAVSIEVEDAPQLTVEAAAERLLYAGQPYVFFADLATGRGAVLHVQRDGHFGLVTLD
ncbi:sigma 54 modulation/S30EA ribosomal C-terminal domain-containing protein [Cryptosporangium minutisporangium]|uniref:HPF/RaiA family ribosome-associated protein n=1 Tax=Cryptosporangium minutisporangium TaxID=113569 RepID=A0ABP6T780_9ACTN